jgi:hypothetical protein
MTNNIQNKFLNEEQENKAIEWLSKKCSKGAYICEICGTGSWMVSGNVVAPLNLINGNIAFGGNITPQFMIMCRNCGNTKYFNALISGVLENEKEEGNVKSS